MPFFRQHFPNIGATSKSCEERVIENECLIRFSSAIGGNRLVNDMDKSKIAQRLNRCAFFGSFSAHQKGIYRLLIKADRTQVIENSAKTSFLISCILLHFVEFLLSEFSNRYINITESHCGVLILSCVLQSTSKHLQEVPWNTRISPDEAAKCSLR